MSWEDSGTYPVTAFRAPQPVFVFRYRAGAATAIRVRGRSSRCIMDAVQLEDRVVEMTRTKDVR